MAKEKASFGEAVCFYCSFFGGHVRPTVWSLAFQIYTMLPQLAMPVLVKVVVDHYIPAQDKRGILAVIGIMAVLLALNVLFATAQRAIFVRVIKEVSRDLRNKIVSRLQTLSLTYFYSKDSGRYYSKIMVDVDRTERFANVFVNNVFNAIVMLGVLVGVLCFVNARVLLMFLVIFPALLFFVKIFKGSVRRSRHFERLAREDLSSSVSTFLQTSLLARLHGHEGFERRKVDNISAEVVEKSTEAEAQVGLFSALVKSTNIGFHILVLGFAAAKVIDGALTIGEMMLFVTYVGMIRNNFVQIVNVFPTLTAFAEATSSIREVLESPDVEYNQGKRCLDTVRGEIGFDHVSFAYDEGKCAVMDLDLKIPAGTTVALVGQSGAGKSTFVNLMLGLYRTNDGVISIDGFPVNELNMRSVRRQIAVVNQDPILFSGTILENIVHAYGDVPQAKVVEAARRAHAHDFILELKDGYDSQCGEGGVLLSGGQRQRIALARAILREPSILVLDEATSALDSVSERLVQGAIEVLTGQVTTVVIAHRLSTIRDADIILVFRDGRIVEKGTHDELAIRDGGEYAELLRHQSMESRVA